MKNFICGALRDLVPFVQFKKREKHPNRTMHHISYAVIAFLFHLSCGIRVIFGATENFNTCKLTLFLILAKFNVNEFLMKERFRYCSRNIQRLVKTCFHALQPFLLCSNQFPGTIICITTIA